MGGSNFCPVMQRALLVSRSYFTYRSVYRQTDVRTYVRTYVRTTLDDSPVLNAVRWRAFL